MKTSSDTRPGASDSTSWHIDHELQKILKDNPFGKANVQREWAGELSNLRKCESGPCDLSFDFVLDDDKDFIREAGLVKPVRAKVLPQPWTGHPQAPVWFLLLNPGFCAKDYYDHLNVSETMRKCIMQSGQYTSQSFELSDAERDRKLEERQDLILSNLRLDSWPAPFYLLDDSFKTGEDGSDGYSWWFRHLSLKGGDNSFFSNPAIDKTSWADTVGRCLFVLEAFPYHSSTFPGNMIPKWVENETDYFKFWKRLIQYGLKNGKEIVVRARKGEDGSLRRLLEGTGIDLAKDNVHYVKNVRNVSFTAGNITDYESVQTAISTMLSRD